MPIEDPMKFWENNPLIVKGLSDEKTFRQKFEYPDVKDENGKPIFESILMYICQTSGDWLKGYIVLDDEWNRNPGLKDYRTQLAQFKTPFGGRRAYFGRIQISNIEYDVVTGKNPTDNKPIIQKRKETRILKPQRAEIVKENNIETVKYDSAMIELNINIFHNELLGWKKEWAEPFETVEGFDSKGAYTKQQKPIEDFKEVYHYHKINSFISNRTLIDEIELIGKTALKPGVNVPFELNVLLIGSEIKPNVKNPKYFDFYLDKVI